MCAVTGEGEEGEEGGEQGREEGEDVDVSALQNQLSDYRDIIGRQEELLQVCVYIYIYTCIYTAPPLVWGCTKH